MLNRMRNLFYKFSLIRRNSIPVIASVTNKLLSKFVNLSDFSSMKDEDIFENLYVYEPEIGGAIDRISTLVAMSYKGFVLNKENKTEKDFEMMEILNRLDKIYDIRNIFETWSEILLIYGNLFVRIHDDGDISTPPKLEILPNKYISIVDREIYVGVDGENLNHIITTPEYYIVNEDSLNRIILPSNEVIHIKYKDTPIFWRDSKSRETFGIYSVSPLHRLIFPVWWKRQIFVVDIKWRWKRVPREHHQLDTSNYSISNYSGSTPAERKANMEADIRSKIQEHAKKISMMSPDQDYVTTKDISINVIDPSSGNYMQPNEMLEQLKNYIWMALNIPESAVSGASRGSYASELVVSSYLTAKVLRIAEKIKIPLLQVIKNYLLQIDDEFDVESLDIKLELIMDTNRMEQFRQAAIMTDIGGFTINEIRNHVNYPDVEDGEVMIIDLLAGRETRGRDKGEGNTSADEKKKALQTYNDTAPPDTPHSKESRNWGDKK